MLQSVDITKSLPSIIVGAMAGYEAPAVSMQSAQEEFNQNVTVSNVDFEASVVVTNNTYYEVLSQLYEVDELVVDQIIDYLQGEQTRVYLFLIDQAAPMIKKVFGSPLMIKLGFDNELQNIVIRIHNSLEFEKAYQALDQFFDALLSSEYEDIFKKITFVNEPFYGL